MKLADKSIQLYIDIMYVNNEAYLISISKPINLTIVDYLKGYNSQGPKSVDVINKTIINIINIYRSEGYFIYEILCGNDPSFKRLPQHVNGNNCKVSYVSPKSDTIVTIDRKIRFIKDRCRSMICGLLYQIPTYLYKYLIFFVISRINLINHSYSNINNISSKELFTVIRTDYNKDIRHYFGEYVQTITPETNNTMVERTNRCIALSPSGDKDGSVYFFHIKTKKIIKRNKWKTLPMTNEIIESINNLSKGENNEIIFKYQNHTIDETEIFEDKPIINESIDQQYSLVGSIPNQNDINLFNDIQQS